MLVIIIVTALPFKALQYVMRARAHTHTHTHSQQFLFYDNIAACA